MKKEKYLKKTNYYKDIIVIIKRMNDLYNEQTKITHDNPTYDEKTASILDQYTGEEDDYYMYKKIMK